MPRIDWTTAKKELADARVKLAEGEKEFEEKEYRSKGKKIADGKAALNRGKLQLANAEETQEKVIAGKVVCLQSQRPCAWCGVNSVTTQCASTISPSSSPYFSWRWQRWLPDHHGTHGGGAAHRDRDTEKRWAIPTVKFKKKYLIYSLSATVVGSLVGLSVGFKAVPHRDL